MAFSFSSAINNLVAGAAENVADVVTCLNDVKTVLNNGITGTDHMSASAAVADTQLASPNNAIRKLVHSPAQGIVVGGAAGGTYAHTLTGALVASAGAGTVPTAFYFDPADYAVAGKTTKLLVKASAMVNATAPAVNFTMGYSLVTATAGGAGGITESFGAAAGSTAVINAPGANGVTTITSSQFAAFATGTYTPTVLLSGATNANSYCALVWQLFVVNV